MLSHLQSLLGIVVILSAAWVMSENRRAFPFRTVISGLALQIGLALLPLKAPGARDARSTLIMVYALCGFANFSSVGILIAGTTPWCRNGAARSSRWFCARLFRERWRAA